MKTAGIIGGIGPESTTEYYRGIIKSYREQRSDGTFPSIIINSIDNRSMLDLIAAHKLPEVTEYLAGEIERLAQAGAEFGALAANTPHIVFEELQRQSRIPLISIVEITCQAAGSRGLKRAGLFGTQFTMEGCFYPDIFRGAWIDLVIPTPGERSYIHDIYMSELLNGIFLSETRLNLLAIANRMKAQEGIEALILGGTELPLILRQETDTGVPFLDTTGLHVEAIVSQLLS